MKALLIPVLSALALVAGCNEEVKPSSAGYPVTTIYKNVECGRRSTASQATWIDDSAELESTLVRLNRNQLSAQTPPEVDFENYGVLLVELGQRPTAGYQLSLASPRMVMDKGDGVVTLAVQEPTGGMVAQVITSPCILVSVPRADYRMVRALSVDQQLKLQAALP